MTNNEPLVSVLMPYYELAGLLIEAVKSIMAQTYTNWELVVVDDDSPNFPASQALATIDDARVKIFRNKENLGIAATKNAAASHSTGELLLPLDADDKLANNYIERTLQVMLETGASAVYTDVQIFGMHDYVHTPSHNLGDIFSGHIPFNTLLLKRELYDAVGGYDKNVGLLDDTEFWVSMIELGKPFAHIPEPLYLYRRHTASTAQNSKNMGKDFYALLLRHRESLVQHLPQVLSKWGQSAWELEIKAQAETTLLEEYKHLHHEFHELLDRYEKLEKKTTKNEQTLASFPKLARQISYLTLKKIGLR